MVIGRVVAIIVAIIVDQLRKHRRPRVSQSVNTGRRWRGKYCFASRGEQIIVEKCHARFIKKISQLKSDIRSCRCKNFSLKVVSVRSDRGGSGPPGPSPWIRHCKVGRKHGSSDFSTSTIFSSLLLFVLQGGPLPLAVLH